MNKAILHTVFEAAAERFPENTAVVHGSRTVSYEVLRRNSRALALTLKSLGVRDQAVVGLWMESSVAYVTALIAVLKAGGVFLPLDTQGPEKRLARILTTSTPFVTLVGQGTDLSRLEKISFPGIRENFGTILTIDETGVAQGDHSPAIPRETPPPNKTALPLPDPDDPAYIVYTSGTTGLPKAILGRQKSLSHFMHWEAREFSLEQDLRVSQIPAVTFDASLRDIFTPLIVGGSVHIPEAADRSSTARLLGWMEKSNLTLIHCTPSLFRLLMGELELNPDPQSRLPNLKKILLAGEGVYGRDILRWQALAGKRIELVNLYGPSETTLIKSFYRVPKDPGNPEILLPVGRPIANTALLILNKDRLCRIGEPGEIFIKTPFMTKGYYKNPEETQKRFIPNPLTRDPKDLVYRTGDLGYYLPDRQVVFMGRIDSQVKINGVRVEPGEVEKAVMGVEGVQQALVVSVTAEDGENCLVCYYTSNRDFTGTALRTHLRQELPAPMIPAYFIHLDAFPINTHGKIDRQALPSPLDAKPKEQTSSLPGQGTIARLAEIWEAVLGPVNLDSDSSFFDHGGHSLKAMAVVSRIYRRLGVEISLKAFFEHHTLEKLAALVTATAGSAMDEILRAPDNSPLPLSPGQKRLWLLDRMDTDKRAYILSGGWLIKGSLDVDALERAVEALIERHDSLRTTITLVNNEPELKIKEILPNSNSFLTVLSRDNTPDTGQPLTEPDLAQAMLIQEARTPFDLHRGPLLRIFLADLEQNRYFLGFAIHHIICDAWSFEILAQELSLLYKAFALEKPSPLPPLKLKYSDWALHHHELLASGALDTDARYWREKLAQPLPVLDLHADFPRPPVQAARGEYVSFKMNRSVTQGLNELRKNQGATLFMILLALVKVMLFRRSRQPDIIVGAPGAGRDHPDLEGLVGFFVNTLVLRDVIREDQGFQSVLNQVKKTTLEAYEHQAYPFDRLVDELPVERDAGRAPFFDVMMVLLDDSGPGLNLGETELAWIQAEPETSRFDLSFEFTEQTEEQETYLELRLVYNRDLFSGKTMTDFGESFMVLAESVVKDPDLPVKNLEILPETEKERILYGFNRPKTPFPDQLSLVDLFRSQAGKSPEAAALSWEQEQDSGGAPLTYTKLDQMTDGLAGLLIEDLKVTPGDRVGVMVARGPWTVTALLGILKSGGTYLPIDPDYPTDRIAFMLEDSGCRVLLTDQDTHEFPLKQEVRRIRLDRVADGQLSSSCPYPGPGPRDLAYIIYTSGSTGKPKGVMVEHRGFVNMILDQINTFGLTPEDRVLQFASPGFDASLSEIFMALLSGACVVMINKSTINDPLTFLKYVDKTNTTVITFPPRYLNALNRRGLTTVRTIITAGEPALAEDLAWYSKNRQVFNAYGPTEASVCATIHQVDPHRTYDRAMPIGRQVANLALFILDPTGHLVPRGVPGEICLAGPGLARGYLNRPGPTRKNFVPHPFAKGRRLYRTGDMGRYLPDGEILYLGRLDEQVKIRGHRVEPGEIAAVLTSHPGVAEAAVLVLKDQVTAFIKAEATPKTSAPVPADVRSHTARFLAAHMIPRHMIMVDAIPLTPNGKTDIEALASLAAGPMPDNPDAILPRTPFEKKLASLWQAVLGKKTVGIHDNFFDIGGDSLICVRLVSRGFDDFDGKLSAKLLFMHPTVSGLATAMESQGQAPPPSCAPDYPAGKYREKQSLPPHISIQRRNPSSLITSGEVAPVDSVALTYLPDHLTALSGVDSDVIIREWFGSRPMVTSILTTPLGRIAKITLPRFASKLFDDSRNLAGEVRDSLALARDLGARTVSLTGLLPSAAAHSLTLAPVDGSLNGLPRVTMGRATILAAMAMSTRNLLDQTRRRMDDQVLGILGTGSLARTLTGLMLSTFPHPPKILVHDPQKNRDQAEAFMKAISQEYGYQGNLQWIQGRPDLPDKFYKATLILGTTHAPGILNVDRLTPGTLIVDETVPHIFDPDQAVFRAKTRKDIFFTEGDVLATPSPVSLELYLAPKIEAAMNDRFWQSFIFHRPWTVTGCVLSGLIAEDFATFGQKPARVGVKAAARQIQILKGLGFEACQPICGEWDAPGYLAGQMPDPNANTITPAQQNKENSSL